ncbi:MAG: hypothetical protein ACE5KC_01495 [Candidatus Bathyarchaeia archaeon]
MPASSIDTFFACSVMIILVLSAMVGASKLMTPYISGLSHRNDAERFQQLASLLLLNAGTPSNWGQLRETVPSSLGLAKADALLPYELDIDKVSRLNSENAYSLTYRELWESLGMRDVAFQIEVGTLFELSIEPISNQTQGDETTYEFEVETERSGMPVSADLSGYVFVKNFVDNVASSTSSNGVGSLSVSIPNSVNGTTLLLVFAKAKADPRVVSFNVYAFGHNSATPLPNRTFLSLSPLNYVLNASFAYPATGILKTQVFTFNYNFSLTERAQGNQTAEYNIPRLIDSSPMIIALTGLNGSSSFAEWVSYPQLPLQVGSDFSQSSAGAKIFSETHIVTINSALYQVVTRWGGPA